MTCKGIKDLPHFRPAFVFFNNGMLHLMIEKESKKSQKMMLCGNNVVPLQTSKSN